MMVPPNDPAVRLITGFAGKRLFVTADTVDEHHTYILLDAVTFCHGVQRHARQSGPSSGLSESWTGYSRDHGDNRVADFRVGLHSISASALVCAVRPANIPYQSADEPGHSAWLISQATARIQTACDALSPMSASMSALGQSGHVQCKRMSALCQKRTFKKYRHDKERPPRGGLSENSITLTTISSAALLMLH